MELKDTKETFKRLREYFPANVIQWLIVATFTYDKQLKAIVHPFIDARVLMNRLDDVLGPENWQTRFSTLPSGHLVCAIGLRINNEWIWKEDGGGSSIDINSDDDANDDKTDTKSSRDPDDSARGDFTNAFKRCLQGPWGIGRYLYLVKNPIVKAEKKDRSTKLLETPSLPAEYLPTRSKPPTTRKTESKQQKPTTKDDKETQPVKEEKKAAQNPPAKKDEKATQNPPPKKEEKAAQNPPDEEKQKTSSAPTPEDVLQRAYAYKIPEGYPFPGKTLEQAAQDVWIGKGVIGYLAGKLPHPKMGDMYAPLSEEEVRLGKAAEYIWNHVFANEEPKENSKK